MITIEQYDITQPSMRKVWKAEFYDFLIEYYRPSLINAKNVFKAIINVDKFIKKNNLGDKMLLIKDVGIAQNVRSSLLSHRSFAMRATVSANDYKVIVLDRYIDFLLSLDRQAAVTPRVSKGKIDEDGILKATEGMMKEVLFFRKQRNRTIRDQCAARDNYTCQICDFNFEKVYGERGKDFIEVHHLNPLASYDEEHEVKLDELIALCSNCHSMIHYGSKLMKPENLIDAILAQKNKTGIH